jgi:hypothetical protein
MPAIIQVIGLDSLTNRMTSWPRQIDDAVHDQVLVEVRPLMSTMHGLASSYGGVARKAAEHLTIASTQDGVSVTAGGAPMIFGAEFGSHRKRRRSLVTRSRRGTPFVVPRRRTTMQFKPHLGRRGYWFWPAVRTDLKGINRRVFQIIMKAVEP